MAIRLLIVDDHWIFRAGLRNLLSSLNGILVVGEAANGSQAIRMVADSNVDLVLMDVTMPEMNGIEATRIICKEHPEIRVVMLTRHTDEECILQALRAGAVGYLTKQSNLTEIEEAIRAVMRGETFVSQSVSHSLVSYVRKTSGESEDSTLMSLSPRQREILQLIAEGYSTQQIAKRLNISIKTVETHRHLLMERLNIPDIVGLVRFAISKGLVQKPE